jgi:hypothetical protein
MMDILYNILGSIIFIATVIFAFYGKTSARHLFISVIIGFIFLALGNLGKFDSFSASLSGIAVKVKGVLSDAEATKNTLKQIELIQKELTLNYTPAISIKYDDEKFLIHNDGKTSINIWQFMWGPPGSKLNYRNLDDQPSVLPPGEYYHLPSGNFENVAIQDLGDKQDVTFPCALYFTDVLEKKHTVECDLVARKSIHGTFGIDTRVLRISDDGW